MDDEPRPGGPQRTRDRLIDGVGRAVANHGVRHVTMGQILEASSLARRTFYLHFRSKEEAITVLYETVLARMREPIMAALQSTDDPAGKLLAGLDAFLAFQQEAGRTLAVLQAEAADPSSYLHPVRARSIDDLVVILNEGNRAVLGYEVDPLVYGALFAGMIEVVIRVRAGGAFGDAERERVLRAMRPLFAAMMASVETMPRVDDGTDR